MTVVVAPAVLTNASALLCLGTGNRIARVVDRTRVLNAELATLGPDDHALGLAVGTVGVTGLVVGCTMMVRETGLAVEFLSDEMDVAQHHASSGR